MKLAVGVHGGDVGFAGGYRWVFWILIENKIGVLD